jgi:choline dehydrogenase-like flavoprotein
MSERFDVIVVGSGAAGAHAASPLVHAGCRVAMLDGGYEAPAWLASAPSENFEDVRRYDRDQARWFLGADFSAIPLGDLARGMAAGTVSGNRRYVVEEAETLLPVDAGDTQILQSLAKGGLAAAWGATCAFLSAEELRDVGLPPDEMLRHYEIVSRRIGVSGPQGRPGIQPPLRLDHHAAALLRAYCRKKHAFDTMGIEVSQPHSAALTEDLGPRRRTAYTDMEYFADPHHCVYRPQYTIDELAGSENFHYLPRHLVQRIEPRRGEVHVVASPIRDGTAARASRHYRARRVILAAGAIGTARVLLRSFSLENQPVPFVSKPHVLTACIHLRMLGRAGPKHRTSLCQLLVYERSGGDARRGACAQLYSYRSPLLFRLLRALPLPVPEALGLLSLLMPSVVFADIRFAASPHASGSLRLEPGGGRVQIRLRAQPRERRQRREALRKLHRALRALGLLPLRTIAMAEGTTFHYAGTVPCSESTSHCLLSTDSNGKLNQSESVYVADASAFRCLPALPHTLTVMANANRVAEHVLDDLGRC